MTAASDSSNISCGFKMMALAAQAVCASNILRNWALLPGSEQLLADARCIDALARALAAVTDTAGPAAAELAGNVLDVLRQVSASPLQFKPG